MDRHMVSFCLLLLLVPTQHCDAAESATINKTQHFDAAENAGIRNLEEIFLRLEGKIDRIEKITDDSIEEAVRRIDEKIDKIDQNTEDTKASIKRYVTVAEEFLATHQEYILPSIFLACFVLCIGYFYFPECLIWVLPELAYVAPSASVIAFISFCFDEYYFVPWVILGTALILLLVFLFLRRVDRHDLHKAAVSFNYFARRDDNTFLCSFTFAAWQEICLEDVGISPMVSKLLSKKCNPKSRFLELDIRNTIHFKIIKKLSMRVSAFFERQWVDSISGSTGTVTYTNKTFAVGLIFEDAPKAANANGKGILQWRIFVMEKDELARCEEQVPSSFEPEEQVPTSDQKRDRYGKILFMRQLNERNRGLVYVTVPVPVRTENRTEVRTSSTDLPLWPSVCSSLCLSRHSA